MSGVHPEAVDHHSWNRKIMNVLERFSKKRQGEAKVMLWDIYFAQTSTRADRLRDDFAQRCRGLCHGTAAKTLERNWELMTPYHDFPKEHWGYLRTTNTVESAFRGPATENRRGQALQAGGRAMALT